MSGNSQTVLVFYNMSLIRNLQVLNSFFISFNSDLKYLNNMDVKVGFEPTTSGFESQRADQTALLYYKGKIHSGADWIRTNGTQLRILILNFVLTYYLLTTVFNI